MIKYIDNTGEMTLTRYSQKKWGFYKKYIDHSYIFFTKIEKSNLIIRPEQRWFK